MAKFKFREIALISLPIVFLGGFGWWANGRQQQRAARENGSYRTRLVSIEDVPLTPFERWQGFDSKVRIVATDDGKPDVPDGVTLDGKRQLRDKIFLVGDKVKLPVSSYGQGTMRPDAHNPGALVGILGFQQTRKELENIELVLLANTKAVPGKARLQGDVYAQMGAYGPKPNQIGDYNARPAKVDKALRASITPLDATVRRAPKLLSTQVAHMTPRETAKSPLGDNGDTSVSAKFDCSALKTKFPTFHFADSRLEDEFGKTVEQLNINGMASLPDGTVTIGDLVKTFQIPANRGQITFKTWFSYSDSWPTPVSIIVRPRPKAPHPPRKLKLQSVRLMGSDVEVRVRYIGALPLETEQNAAKEYNVVAEEMKPAPRGIGVDRLISDYFQHLEYAGGKTQWSGQYVGDARADCAPDKTCIVTYPVPAMRSWYPGQTAHFRAQIGIEDDGFLDIDLPITKPAQPATGENGYSIKGNFPGIYLR